LIEKNIKSLFNISNIPSDTQLRDVIDPIPFESLRPAFDAILSSVQRGNELQKFITLGHYAIALDGTGYFSSSAVKCKHCLTKKIKIKKELKKEEVDGEKKRFTCVVVKLGLVDDNFIATAMTTNGLKNGEVIPFARIKTGQEDEDETLRRAWARRKRRFRRPTNPVLIIANGITSRS